MVSKCKYNENRKKARLDRRTFLKMAGLGAGALAFGGLSGKFLASASTTIPQTQLPGNTIPKYVDALPEFSRVARANGTLPLTISNENHIAQVLPASIYPAGVPGTEVWAYKIVENAPGGRTLGPYYPAFTIEAQRGTPTNVTYQNNLTATPTLYRFITVDQTIHWADPLGTGMSMSAYPSDGPVPVVTHVHGGEVESRYDGGPDSWFTPGTLPPFIKGSAGSPAPGQAIAGPAWNAGVSENYVYPNLQEAATIWYHDHALGATRLNVYAGLAGFYLIRDWANERPDLPGGPSDTSIVYETEIAIQDRMFDTNGQLFFPDIGINMEHPFWVPEFFGDTIVVNGKSWPYMVVEPRRYRFRLLNGSNARFYNLSFDNNMTFYQIGTDGGLMNRPAKGKSLLLAPGERADVIVDFAGLSGNILLKNNARTPFPNGLPVDPATTAEIMQFRVGPGPVADPSYNPAIPGSSPRVAGTVTQLLTNGAGALAPGVVPTVTRRLTLNEVMGMGGPLEILVNNSEYVAPVTENPANGATEIWEIVNMTVDTHPMHLHLVQFQLLNRQRFQKNLYQRVYDKMFPGGLNPADGLTYPKGVFMPGYGPPNPYGTAAGGAIGGNPNINPFLSGTIMKPAPNEIGWKDTIRMNPNEVARVVVRWMPTDVPAGNPGSFTTINPTTGPGYVWHCHIVDHEDNEMMRPYRVV